MELHNMSGHRGSVGSMSDTDYLYYRSSTGGMWNDVWRWDDIDSETDFYADAPEYPYPDTPISTPRATVLSLPIKRRASLEDITALPNAALRPDRGGKGGGQQPPVKDPNLVTWDGPNDPENPKNWSFRRRWAAVIIVSLFTFITPISSTIVAPAFTVLAEDLNITSDIEVQMTLSIFVLAYAIGPLLLAPLSETFGRVPVLQLANLFYFCWNLACGFARTRGEMIAFRFFAGLGGSAPLAIGGGVLSDCFLPEHRGKAISLYSLGPLLGPAIGPVAGGFIAQYTNYRWIFWAPCIVDIAIQLAGFLFLQETYGPVLLKQRCKRLRKATGNMSLHTPFDGPNNTLLITIRRASVRPFRFLATQPIIQVIALYAGFLYGVMYLVLATFPRLWTEHYGEPTAIASLNYLSLAVGFLLGAQIAPRVNDVNYRRLLKKHNNQRKPEFRIPPTFIASILVPVGMFIYGWSAQAHTHWIVPDIGMVIFGAGINVNFSSMQGYTVDCYQRFAASGVAATVVLRSLAGFFFPLFAPYLYKALDYGWGNSVLAIIAIVLGCPAPYLFWFYGAKLRSRSSYAVGGKKAAKGNEAVAGGPGGMIAPGGPGAGPDAGSKPERGAQAGVPIISPPRPPRAPPASHSRESSRHDKGDDSLKEISSGSTLGKQSEERTSTDQYNPQSVLLPPPTINVPTLNPPPSNNGNYHYSSNSMHRMYRLSNNPAALIEGGSAPSPRYSRVEVESPLRAEYR